MSSLTVIDTQGDSHILEAAEGWRVMEIIRDWDVPIGAECGGSATCGQCRVEVAPEWRYKLHPRTPDEDLKLDELLNVTDDTRLSCQIIWNDAYDGLVVHLAASQEG